MEKRMNTQKPVRALEAGLTRFPVRIGHPSARSELSRVARPPLLVTTHDQTN